MIIAGWKKGVNTVDAVQAVKKHTGMSMRESKQLIETALEGQAVKLPDDFVLREDLEDSGFSIQ